MGSLPSTFRKYLRKSQAVPKYEARSQAGATITANSARQLERQMCARARERWTITRCPQQERVLTIVRYGVAITGHFWIAPQSPFFWRFNGTH